MANAKISDLPAASPLVVADKVAISDGTTVSKSATIQNIIDLVPVAAFRGALVDKSVTQDIASSNTTILIWDQEIYDTSSIHDNVTNNSRLTVPAGVTRVRLKAGVEWQANTSGRRNVWHIKNGTDFVGQGYVEQGVAQTGAPSLNISSAVLTVVPGDFFEANVFQSSGGPLNVVPALRTWFSMEVVE